MGWKDLTKRLTMALLPVMVLSLSPQEATTAGNGGALDSCYGAAAAAAAAAASEAFATTAVPSAGHSAAAKHPQALAEVVLGAKTSCWQAQ